MKKMKIVVLVDKNLTSFQKLKGKLDFRDKIQRI